MSAVAHSSRVAPRSGKVLVTFVMALGMLVAIAATVLFLALAGSSRRSSATPRATPVRAHNAVLNPITGEMHGG